MITTNDYNQATVITDQYFRLGTPKERVVEELNNHNYELIEI